MAHLTSPILTTKLFVARPQAPLVQREHLSSKLDEILRRKITLISAPAGFGKTTAIGAWIEGAGVPSGWISLDAGDNDPARFLAYLVEALRSVHPDVGEAVRTALSSPTAPPVEALLPLLVNDLASIREDYILVLDDYHLITDRHVHDALLFILDHTPGSLHIVVTTRVDPPVPLARLRVRGDLMEIRASDLRFSSFEALRFFNDLMGLTLDERQMEALQAKTEGWAAGLQMAALSLQGRSDIDAFITAFTGADRYVIDYLLEEVLAQLPEEQQRTMLELSLLDRFNGSLCEAVTGITSGAELLIDLERRNLFLIPLDNRREWYRYHHLFADLLHRRLRQQYQGSVPELHRRASLWFEGEGNIAEAIEHARIARDGDLLARLFETYWHQVLDSYDYGAMLDWLDLIPAPLVNDSPRLQMLRVWGLVNVLRFRDAMESLDRMEPLLESMADDELRRELTGHANLIRAVVARDSGDKEGAVIYAERALELLPDLPVTSPKYIWNASVSTLLSILGGAYSLTGDYARAVSAFEQALQSSRAAGDHASALIAYSNISREHMAYGRITAAARTIEQMEEEETKIPYRVENIAAVPFQVRARVHYERFELDAAREAALRAVAAASPRRPTQVLEVNRILMTIEDASGNWDEALRLIEKMEAIALAPHEMGVVRIFPMIRAQIALRMDDPVPAIEWMEEKFKGDGWDDFDVAGAGNVVHWEQLLRARALLELERWDDVDRLLRLLHEGFARHGLLSLQIEAMLLRVMADQRRGNHAAALDLLVEALRIAAPEGLVRPFAYVARDIVRLLAGAQKRAPQLRLPSAFLRRVCDACGLGSSDRSSEPGGEEPAIRAGSALEDMVPLTSREVEILGLLAQGYSNQKIAERLYVSINTVKTHVSNLFEKLGASSRVDALLRARSARLL